MKRKIQKNWRIQKVYGGKHCGVECVVPKLLRTWKDVEFKKKNSQLIDRFSE